MLCQLSYRRETSLTTRRYPMDLVVLDRLHLEELLEAVQSTLTTDARLLVAAEGRERVEGATVDRHLAGTDLARDFERLLVGRGPHAAGQSVGRVVRDCDRLLLGVVGDDRQHGTEDLLLRDRHVGAHVGEDRGLHVEAF